jgi:hypothetical protein
VHGRAFRLARHLDALAGAVEVPAVKRAAQAVVLTPAIAQVRPAVRALARDQAKFAFIVAEQHQVLAEQAHRHHRARALKLVGQGSGLPVVAHQLAARGARSGAGDEVVDVGCQHGPSPEVFDRAGKD